MLKKTADRIKNLLYFFKDLKQTGAVAPSSKFLAQNMASQLKERVVSSDATALNILEVGPGTGSMTKEIIKQLRPQDRLDLVEIQKDFYQIVQKKYAGDNVFAHFNDILSFSPDRKYDFIFSSLPYENMDPELGKKIWNKKIALCSPESYICYFKYVNIRKFKNDFEEETVKKYLCEKKTVFRNLPPAKTYTLQIDK